MTRPGPPRPRYPGGRKTLWGTAAFAASYLVTYAWIALDARGFFSNIVVGGDYSDPITLATALDRLSLAAGEVPGSTVELTGGVLEWKVAGVFVYGAHGVNSRLTLPNGLETTISPVVDAGIPYVGLLLVPPACLALGGYMATRDVTGPFDFTFDLGGSTASRYALNGGFTTLLGYLPPALVGGFLVTGHFQPNVVTAWLLAGLVYPVVFGGLGGLVAYRFGDDYSSPDANAALERVQRTD